MKKVGAMLLAILLSFPIYPLQALSAETALRVIGGKVQDSEGHAVQDAEMTIQDPNGNLVARGLTNGKGEYTLGCLVTGEYRLSFAPPQTSGLKGPQAFVANLGKNGLTVNVTSSKTALPVALARNPGPASCGPGGLKNPGTVAIGSGLSVAAVGGLIAGLCLADVICGHDDGGRRQPASPSN